MLLIAVPLVGLLFAPPIPLILLGSYVAEVVALLLGVIAPTRVGTKYWPVLTGLAVLVVAVVVYDSACWKRVINLPSASFVVGTRYTAKAKHYRATFPYTPTDFQMLSQYIYTNEARNHEPINISESLWEKDSLFQSILLLSGSWMLLFSP